VARAEAPEQAQDPTAAASAATEVPPELVAQSLGEWLRAWLTRIRSGDSGVLPVILALLIATHKVSASGDVPLWVVLAAHSAIAAGTLTGGWRVVHTLGSRITKLQPHGGVAAESAAAATIFFVTAHGIPVSTTHTITGSIVGVGSTQSVSAVRWGLAGNIVWAWVLTIPCSAFMAGLAWWLARLAL